MAAQTALENICSPPTPPSSSISRSQSPFPTSKFVSLAQRVQYRHENNDPFFSFEFFPPRTANGALNLLSRMERMGQGDPLFCDITWHVAGNPSSYEPTSSITFAMAMTNHCGLNTMLHVTSCNQTLAQIDGHLSRVKDLGVSSLLLLRGDPPAGEDWDYDNNCFNYASEFVRYVRDNHGDAFTIAVAGYPMGHPDGVSYEDDLHYLKLKVDAGADFIITQLFFDSSLFVKFVKDCRAIGINCPIIPGILPIQGYQSLRHITKLGRLDVPKDILDVVEPIKDNDEAIRNFGIEFGAKICREILESGVACGLHFYTLNREVATISILKRIGLWPQEPQKVLPWKPTASSHRFQEDVRPIFWASRPKSYVARTSDWEEFPNGRWGNSSAATFGDITDHHLFYLGSKRSKEERLNLWGRQLNGEEDVWKVFSNYIQELPNDQGYKVTDIPWNEDKLASETRLISGQLAELNSKGILTINSQPRANGESSAHPQLGWGKPGGYVYQKAYLEFFVAADKANMLKKILPKYSPRVNYHIINFNGDEDFTNCDSLEPIAVTWGVFPGKEIIQPTVVDPIAFTFWKDEAFGLWQEHWGSLYPPESISRKVINYIVQNYYLVNLVDNNYPEESVLWQICHEMIDATAEAQLKTKQQRMEARSHEDRGDGYKVWPQKVGRRFEDRENATGLKRTDDDDD